MSTTFQRLVLVRHAESTNNDRFARTGARDGREPDPRLSPLGERQVARAGAAIAELTCGITTPVWASPTARAVATAGAIVRAGTGAAVELVPDLVEGGGIYDYVDGVRHPVAGRSQSELAELAGVPVRWRSPALEESWDGGMEAMADVPARAARLIETLRQTRLPEVVLVGHEWIAQHIIRAALGLTAGNDAIRRGWFHIPNASITEIILDAVEGHPVGELVRVGDTHHLGDEVPQSTVRFT